MSKQQNISPLVLCILDGWGHRLDPENNAVFQARTPNYDRFLKEAPFSLLDASEGFVGLPGGQMGNSEVGHMNIGAGRVVMQDLPRIDADLESGAFLENAELARFVQAVKERGGRVHVMGLLSPGGVHSHQRHIGALMDHFAAIGQPAMLHAFMDGRDTPPRSGADHMKSFLAQHPAASVATLSGRYFAMDRDKRWDRVAKAYHALCDGQGRASDNPLSAIEESYANDVGDEFIEPCVIDGYEGMRDGDGLLMANFRADRAREIITALIDPAFEGFDRPRQIDWAAKAGMVSYSDALAAKMLTLYPPIDLQETLGEVVSSAGLKQLRIAETEKYAHVTFFLNGGREDPFVGEDRILIPSPKVATYDLQPAMSAGEVTDELVATLEKGEHQLIIVNFANGDMVGHTGILSAAIEAVETLDLCLGRLEEAVTAAGGALLITADHGNCEQMVDPQSGEAHTAHTMNKVPFLLVGDLAAQTSLGEGRMIDGRLADIAPTILSLMGLQQPDAMTGQSLWQDENRHQAAE